MDAGPASTDPRDVDKSAEWERPPPTPEDDGWLKLLHAIADRVDPLLKLLTAVAERSLKAREAEARFQIWMAWIAVIVVLAIVGVAGFLTYADKVDGSTFTFLLGLIVGYVLTFIRDSLQPEGGTD